MIGDDDDDELVVWLSRGFSRLLRNPARISRQVLPSGTPVIQHILAQRDDNSYLKLTGLNVRAFDVLHRGYQEGYNKGLGRPRTLDSITSLALALCYMRGKAFEYELCAPFQLPETTLSDSLWYAMRRLDNVLHSCDDAKIVWPSSEQMVHFSDLIATKQPILDGDYRCFGMVDGCMIEIESRGKKLDADNADYCGWVHKYAVENLFLWTPDGLIVACSLNYPGSVHDASMFGAMQEALLSPRCNPDRLCIISDAGLPRHFKDGNRVIGAMKADEMESAVQNMPEDALEAKISVGIAATKVRQAAEWGNSQLKHFARLTTPLTSAVGKRSLILRNVVRLHNFRTRVVGYSQIRTSFAQ